jgi:hypothetical protein
MADEDRSSGLTKKIEISAMSPLADPVVEKIYKDENVAGLAAESFIDAVLSECGEALGTVFVYDKGPRDVALRQFAVFNV